jgi:hypothetical protein
VTPETPVLREFRVSRVTKETKAIKVTRGSPGCKATLDLPGPRVTKETRAIKVTRGSPGCKATLDLPGPRVTKETRAIKARTGSRVTKAIKATRETRRLQAQNSIKNKSLYCDGMKSMRFKTALTWAQNLMRLPLTEITYGWAMAMGQSVNSMLLNTNTWK